MLDLTNSTLKNELVNNVSKTNWPKSGWQSLPIMFSIVRTAGASPAELTNGKSYVWFFTKFIASGASPDASCPSLLALISAAGASPDAKLIKLDIEHHVVGV